MSIEFDLVVLEPTQKYFKQIDPWDETRIVLAMMALQFGEFESVQTKQLKEHVRELIVGPHRITYFIHEKSIYFVRGFRKRSQKTPKREIDYAEKWYRNLTGKS